MNRPTTIALIGAIHVGRMFVTAVVLMAAIEAVAFAQMALQGRK
jgi:predicted homoserine dehydrogenase-like protein